MINYLSVIENECLFKKFYHLRWFTLGQSLPEPLELRQLEKQTPHVFQQKDSAALMVHSMQCI